MNDIPMSEDVAQEILERETSMAAEALYDDLRAPMRRLAKAMVEFKEGADEGREAGDAMMLIITTVMSIDEMHKTCGRVIKDMKRRSGGAL